MYYIHTYTYINTINENNESQTSITKQFQRTINIKLVNRAQVQLTVQKSDFQCFNYF